MPVLGNPFSGGKICPGAFSSKFNDSVPAHWISLIYHPLEINLNVLTSPNERPLGLKCAPICTKRTDTVKNCVNRHIWSPRKQLV